MGPFGSGKSVGCVHKIMMAAQQMPKSKDGKRRSRWLVVRNSYRELEDTTIKTWLEWVPEGVFGIFKRQAKVHEVRFNDVELDVMFRSLDNDDDVRKILSLEITGAWINEAREVPWVIMKNIQGRLGRFPRQSEVPEGYWTGIIMDTNPPDLEHWWYKFAEIETPKGFRFLRQPSGLDPNAENRHNLPKDYYQRMMQGADEEWVKVHVHAEYGFILEGKPVYPEYRDFIHCTEDVQAIPGVTLVRGWDFGLCYDDKTEVLTDSGFKYFKDVDTEIDLIATRNPQNGNLEYHKAAFKVDMPYEGELLSWESQNVNICVTPEHIIPYTNRDTPGKVLWNSAQWLSEHMGGHHYVDLTANWHGFQLNSWDKIDYARFMGLFLSEGSSDGRKIRIYQSERNPEMEYVLKRFEHKGSWKWFGEGWELCDVELATFLKQFGTAKYKRIPKDILDSEPFTLLQFVSTYTWGDGHIRDRDNGSQEHTIFTCSEGMADDLQVAALRLGWTSSKKWVPPQKNQKPLSCGRTILGSGGWSIHFKKTIQRAELLRKNFKKVPYNGRVYCLNVPYHTLYVRRNGVPSWNGNTPACVFLQIDTKGRVIVLDELVSEDMGIDRFSDIVIQHTKDRYGGLKVQDFGDPAGQTRGQTDERTCFQILWNKRIEIEGGKQTPTIRIESVKKALNTMVEGKPGFLLHPRCKTLRKGFMGGYQYRKLRVSGWTKYSEAPDKNAFSHPHDALQYPLTILYAAGLTDPYHDIDEEDMEDEFNDYNFRGRSATTGY
jgi:hypothetical protein